MDDVTQKLLELVFCKEGALVAFLAFAFFHRDRQAEIERKRADQKFNKLFTMLEHLTTSLVQKKDL